MNLHLDFILIIQWWICLQMGLVRALDCPVLCDCDVSQELSVYCSSQLTAVPYPLPVNVTSLDVSLCSIPELSVLSFPSSLPAMHRLVFYECGLQVLHPDVFRNLVNLVELFLDHNKIRDLPVGVFHGLTKLRTLSLNDNQLLYLADNTFSGLTLNHLNLHDNPELMGMSEHVFNNSSVEALSMDRCGVTGVPEDLLQPLAGSLRILHWSNSTGLTAGCLSSLSLQSLFLTDNDLQDTSILQNVQATHIYLSNNHIQTVDLSQLQHTETLDLHSNDIEDLTSNTQLDLRELLLSHNRLKHLAAALLQAMPNLTKLDVSNNSLQYLSPSLQPAFSRLQVLDVSHNPIVCNCSMEWYRRWLHSAYDRVLIQGQACALTLSQPSNPCEGPHIVKLVDISNDTTYAFLCVARGLPIPNIHWSYNTTSGDVITSLHNDSTSSSTLVISKKAVLPKCSSVECYAQNSMGVMHHSLKYCADVDTSSLLGDDVMAPYTTPMVAIAVGISLTLVTVTVLSKCLRGLYIRMTERQTAQPVSQRSLIAEDDNANNLSDDTDV